MEKEPTLNKGKQMRFPLSQRCRAAINKKDDGFTLIELLIVLIILGILLSVAISSFSSVRQGGFKTSSQTVLNNAAKSMEVVYLSSRQYPQDTDELIEKSDYENSPNINLEIKDADVTDLGFCIEVTHDELDDYVISIDTREDAEESGVIKESACAG